MEPNLISSRKRKCLYAIDPFSGTFTRSKSQVYVHQSRSGRTRRDSARLKHPRTMDVSADLRPQKKLSRAPFTPEESPDAEDVFPKPVLDLRARRVYSSSSSSSGVEQEPRFGKDPESDNDRDDPSKLKASGDPTIANLISNPASQDFKSTDSVTGSPIDDDETQLKSETEFYLDTPGLIRENQFPKITTSSIPPAKEPNLDSVNVLDCSKLEISGDLSTVNLIFKSGSQEIKNTEPGTRSPIDDAENQSIQSSFVLNDKAKTAEPVNGVTSSSPEYTMKTPKDGVFQKAGTISHALQKPNRVLQKGTTGNAGFFCSSMKAAKPSNGICRRELFLNPSSRTRVFKTPNSFTYKRLLPLLIDIAKEDRPTNIVNKVPKLPPLMTKQSSLVESKPPGQTLIRQQPCGTVEANGSEIKSAISLSRSSPTVGILKKNPRGCRGLCQCLNCASFRLHAERAFEFSRNQMLDAEEIAAELIKEMSCLRRLLTAGDGEKAKEARRRSSMVEEVAAARFVQMKEELNIHCKIRSLERPKVTFAPVEPVEARSKADDISPDPAPW